MQTVPDEASVFGNKRWLGVNSGQSDDAVGVESDFFGVYQGCIECSLKICGWGCFLMEQDESWASNKHRSGPE